MIRLVTIIVMLAAIVALFAIWHAGEGFVPWDIRWWRWLIATWFHYGFLPAGMMIPLAGTMAVMIGAPVAATALGRRIGARTVHGDFGKTDLHGSARWADKRDVAKASLFSDAGVTVGSFNGTPLRHEGPEHILCFAPTRSGKGVSIVLPTLLEWQESAVILDIKGENFALTSGWRASQGQRVLRFDPTAQDGSIRFNPLEEVRAGTPHEFQDCQNIAAMIIDPDGKGLRDFWMQSGFEWLSAAILHVLYRIRREEARCASLADVNAILSGSRVGDDSEDVLEDILDDMIGFEHGREPVDDEVRRCAMKMKGRAGPERSGVHSSSLTQLALYADPIIAKNIGASDFRLDDLMNGDVPASLYLVIPPSDIDRLRPLVRVVFNLLLRRLTADMSFEDGRAARHYRHRLLLMLDEFTSIGKLEIFEKALAFMAGYGLKCCIIVQDLTQLQQAYGREESIVSNCHLRIAFAPNKIETARVLSDMAGKTTIVQKKRSRSAGGGKDGASISDSLSETARPLITPDECMQLPGPGKNASGDVVTPGAMLIFPAGHPPIRGRQRLYFLDDELTRRARMAPSPAAAAAPARARPSYAAMLENFPVNAERAAPDG